MKLVGITSIGSYYCPFFPYGIASAYKVCDAIVVVNGGFDINNPKLEEYNVPLKRVSKDIADLDIQSKIMEVTHFTMVDLKKPLRLAWDHQRLPYLKENWVDLRGLGLQIAHEYAFFNLNATAILKWDTDNVFYDLTGLRGETQALQFMQYEFAHDLFHLADPPPTDLYNDAPYLYVPTGNEWYYGGGGPMLNQERRRSQYKSAHLRQCSPLKATEEEKWQHFYSRAFYHTWANEGLWGEELKKKARSIADEMMKPRGIPSRIRPPAVCLVDPKAYIESLR